MGSEQSTNNKKDASLLDISFEARKHVKVVEEDVLKLQNVQLALSEGVEALNHTLCQDCKRKLHNNIPPSSQSITTKKGEQKIKRLPSEYLNVLKELEIILLQKEKLINGGKNEEQYGTIEEWHDQEIADLKAQHEREMGELRMELDNQIKEMSEEKRRNQELAEKYKTQFTEHQAVIASYDIRMSTKDRMIENKETSIASFMCTITRQEDDIKSQDKRINELSQPNPQEKSTQTEPKEETETKQSSVHLFSKGGQKDEQNTVRLENVKLRSDLQRASQEKEQIEKTLLEKKNELTMAHSQMEKLHDEKTNLIADLRAVKEESNTDLRGKHDELTRVLSQIDKLYNERTNLIADLQNKTEELQRQQEQLDDSHQENQQIRHDLNEQGEELQTLRGQLEEKVHSRKKSIVMGLHCNRSGLGKPLVDMVIKELTGGVQDRLDRNNINLTIQFSQTPSEVTNWLKVVLCLNMSRVGTNILDTLKGMKGDRDVFVLVLHHTIKDNLSSLTPTSHRVTGSELRQLGGIMDMVFSSDSGLYECDLNNNAIDKIASVLRKYIVI